jgi:hypothetical protein
LGFIRTYDTRCYSLCDRMLHLPIQVNSPLGELNYNSTTTIIPNTIRYTHSLDSLSFYTISDSTGFDVLFIAPFLLFLTLLSGFWLLVAISLFAHRRSLLLFVSDGLY